MLAVIGATSAASTFLSKSVLPRGSLLLAAAASSALNQQSSSESESTDLTETSMIRKEITPRAKSCALMATAMAFHFGGYEFARSGALALFTSNEIGFSHPSAYPFAIGLVTPMSLGLLYMYGLILRSYGPRRALKTTKFLSVSFLAIVTLLLKASTDYSFPGWISKALVAFLFVFQNSYAHLLYSQQWSFLGSVMTPTEGTKYFSAIAGLSSLVCTITATLSAKLAPIVGLCGLMIGTSISLAMSLLLADQAYRLGEKHGFDPTPEIERRQNDKDKKKAGKEESSSELSKTVELFRRTPTLAAMFGEVVTFQSLSTILATCFVRQLKETLPVDTDRAAYSGRFYSYVNGCSVLMQFFFLPLARKYLEPRWAYRIMPTMLLPWLVYLAFQSNSLWIQAVAFFSLKTLDYSVRQVVNEMVYQPLDFESRYVGKEVIGVFANRFGKSGMSMFLSFLTAQFHSSIGVAQLSQFSALVASCWTSCSFWLSRNVVSNAEAERRVKERQQKVTKKKD